MVELGQLKTHTVEIQPIFGLDEAMGLPLWYFQIIFFVLYIVYFYGVYIVT